MSLNNKLIRIYVVTENYFLYYGIKQLIESTGVYKDCMYLIEKTSSLPSVVFHKESNTYNVVVSDINAYCYHINLANPKNTFSLPESYSTEEYIKSFQNMCDFKKKNQCLQLKKMTSQEVTLFDLFSLGISDENIADILKINKKTISAHRRNMLQKLNLKNRHALYMYALSIKGGKYEIL